jgi:hypothetical protein
VLQVESNPINLRYPARRTDTYSRSASRYGNAVIQDFFRGGRDFKVASPNFITGFSIKTVTMIDGVRQSDNVPDVQVYDSEGTLLGWQINAATDRFEIRIPANYPGSGDGRVKVEVYAGSFEPVVFYLLVDTLEKTVVETPRSYEISASNDSAYDEAVFYVNNEAWRVLSNRIGPQAAGHGTGSDYLIITEYAKLENSAWRNPASGNYNGSAIRTAVSNLYNTSYRQWANGFALTPFTNDATWTGTNNARFVTRSTNVRVPNTGSAMNGCFLLSHNEVFARGYYGWANRTGTTAANASYRRAGVLTDGTAVQLWLRSSSSGRNARVIGTNGAAATLRKSNTAYNSLTPMAVRPAMLLSFTDYFEAWPGSDSHVNTASGAARNLIKNGDVFNIASTNFDTDFTIKTDTMFKGNHNQFDVQVQLPPGSGISCTAASDGVVFHIPADHTERIQVSLNVEHPLPGYVFTLNVRSLEDTVKAVTFPNRPFPASSLVSDNDYNKAKFYIDDVAWRVLSNTLSTTGPTGGNDILIITENAYKSKPGGVLPGGLLGWGGNVTYEDSTILRPTLADIYKDEFGWAHAYAVEPRKDGSWNVIGNGNTTTGLSTNASLGELTYSSGQPAGNNSIDGCFLLSWTDYFGGSSNTSPSNYYGWPAHHTQGGGNLNTNRKVAVLDGSPIITWTRSSNVASRALGVFTNGGYAIGEMIKTTANYAIRPAMILRFGSSINALVECDPFRITSSTATTPLPIRDGVSEYLVASTEGETRFTITTDVTGNGYEPLIPVVTVVEDSDDPGIMTSTDKANDETDPYEGETGKGFVVIPAGYKGTVLVTVSSAEFPDVTLSLTLHVDGLEETVNKTPDPAGDYNNAKFYVADQAWRLLSKTLGSTPTNGEDVLITTEHAYTMSVWDNAAAPRNYYRSAVRAALESIYQNDFAWAHSNAILPALDIAWPAAGPTGTTFTGNGSRTTSSGNYLEDSGSFFDGCFLLSQVDLATANFGWLSGTDIKKAARLLSGGPIELWLRTSSSNTNAHRITAAGAVSNDAKTNTKGVRPAMILRFKNVVRFVDWNDSVLKTETVSFGKAAAAPQEDPAREGWEFIGWDREFDKVTRALTVKAVYKEIIEP